MEKKKLIIYCDIDDTICNYKDKKDNYENAIPIKKNIEKMNKLFDEGNDIIYWTARGTITRINYLNLTRKQFKLWGVKFTQLKMGKPVYDIFIDDKNINTKNFFL